MSKYNYTKKFSVVKSLFYKVMITSRLNPNLWNMPNQSLNIVHLSYQPKDPPYQHKMKVKPAIKHVQVGELRKLSLDQMITQKRMISDGRNSCIMSWIFPIRGWSSLFHTSTKLLDLILHTRMYFLFVNNLWDLWSMDLYNLIYIV